MPALILDSDLEHEIISERKRRGIDHYDEVWDGVYQIASPKDNEHQSLVASLATMFIEALGPSQQSRVTLGANVSDRSDSWEQNFRIPDVLVFLKSSTAEDRDTHYFGGPDLAVEITSPGDRAYEKLGFYAAVNTRELLVIDRDPWALVLFRLQAGAMVEVARVTEDDTKSFASEVLPLTFALSPSDRGPQIHIEKLDGTAEWLIDGR